MPLHLPLKSPVSLLFLPQNLPESNASALLSSCMLPYYPQFACSHSLSSLQAMFTAVTTAAMPCYIQLACCCIVFEFHLLLLMLAGSVCGSSDCTVSRVHFGSGSRGCLWAGSGFPAGLAWDSAWPDPCFHHWPASYLLSCLPELARLLPVREKKVTDFGKTVAFLSDSKAGCWCRPGTNFSSGNIRVVQLEPSQCCT